MMTIDEFVRTFCYFLLFPALLYIGLIAWNRRQRLVAVTYVALSMFFALLMVGLLLRHYYMPIPILLYGNTAVVIGLTYAVTWRATVLMMDALRSRVSEFVILREVDQ